MRHPPVFEQDDDQCRLFNLAKALPAFCLMAASDAWLRISVT
jgi:hypothetical protein